MRHRKNAHEVSMGSMADIAFLLLIFFLMATTIESDLGILRKLPPPLQDSSSVEFHDRDILLVLVNQQNRLMVEGVERDIADLRDLTKDFILNINNDKELPEVFYEQIHEFGIIHRTKNHIISLQSDRGTAYKMYIAVQNELEGAYNELRNEISRNRWDLEFANLPESEKKAVMTLYPMKISEAEPNN